MLRKYSVVLYIFLYVFSVLPQEKSDREKNGLFGYVKSVRSETAEFILREGKFVEKKRELDTIETFDIGGNLLTSFTYIENEEVLYGDSFIYDSLGRLSEREVERSPNVYLCDRKIFNYQLVGRKVEEICYVNEKGDVGKTVYQYDLGGNLIEEERIPLKNAGDYFNKNSLKRFKYNDDGDLVEISEFERVKNNWVTVNNGFGEQANLFFSNEQSRTSTQLTYDKDKKLLWIIAGLKDEKGNQLETFRYLPDGSIKDAVRNEFQFDKQGNFVKEVSYKWEIKDGKSYFQPAKVTYRKIEYFNPKEIKSFEAVNNPIREAKVLQVTDKDEYAVYNALLNRQNESLKTENIVIKRFTSSNNLGNKIPLTLENFTQNPVIEQTAIDDFNQKNAEQNSALFADLFADKYKLTLINDSEIKEYFTESCRQGWQRIQRKYPDSKGIITFSRVGFNRSKNKAVVYIGTNSHCLAGAGFILVLQKNQEEWKIISEQMLWVS